MFSPLIVSFADDGTAAIFHGCDTAAARRTCPVSSWPAARRRLDAVDRASTVLDLRWPPGNRLELLRGNRNGQFSVRINQKYRVCFVWNEDGATGVEIVDYH